VQLKHQIKGVHNEGIFIRLDHCNASDLFCLLFYSHTIKGFTMKLSKTIAAIAANETYDEKALLKCLSMKMILGNTYLNVIKRYLAGNTKSMDHVLLGDIAVCLHQIGE
jgi:hypothetical protein